MKRLEERITCQDADGKLYWLEVFREVTRMPDDSQELGLREAFLVGESPRPVKILPGEGTFKIVGKGTILRRVKDTYHP